MICGSLQNTLYWTLPSKNITLDYNKYKNDIIVNTSDCEYYNIDDITNMCELKVDIISENSVCLRLYKKNKDEDECDTIGFSITTKKFLEIAKFYL